MTTKPQFTPIKSSMFKGHVYNPNTRVLQVQFANGSVYEHTDVPADKFEAFVGNASPGAFYNAKIKGNHPGKRIKE